jgi:hypothetical protein
MTWKSYQESLPPTGADGVNNSDGFYSDVNPIKSSLPNETQSLVNLYAVKHNPFAYFKSVQEGPAGNNLANTAGFDGPTGLYADLAAGQAPSFSIIVPNQCNDQHGRGNAGPLCDFDPSTAGTQAGLNPALIYQGDKTIETLVKAIHASPAWGYGHNAIVVWWDENDYSATPNTNQVVLTVETNYGVSGVQSHTFYTHFSLLKSLEAGFGLPCLNHACDANVATMDDLFAPVPPDQVVPESPLDGLERQREGRQPDGHLVSDQGLLVLRAGQHRSRGQDPGWPLRQRQVLGLLRAAHEPGVHADRDGHPHGRGEDLHERGGADAERVRHQGVLRVHDGSGRAAGLDPAALLFRDPALSASR